MQWAAHFVIIRAALSVCFADSSPRGRAIGKPGNFELTAEGLIGRKREGLATEGRYFWTNLFCQSAVNPDSGALHFQKTKNLLVQYEATGPPVAPPLGELAKPEALTERATGETL